jgi:hypothetical protein
MNCDRANATPLQTQQTGSMRPHLHEALSMLFRNRPALAPELLREALHVELPDYTEVRIDSADLTDIQPAEYRADLVILLLHGAPVSLGLDADRSMLNFDLVLHSLPEAARRALQIMAASKYEYQSEFARRYFGEGKAEGIAQGKAEGMAQGKAQGVVQGMLRGIAQGVAQGRVDMLLKQLATRYGQLSAAVAARVQGADAADLDAIAQRVLTAPTLDEALGTRLLVN